MPISTTTSNPHLADQTLRPFQSPAFSSVDYLNSSLPSLTPAKGQPTVSSLPAVAAQTQSHISILSAHVTRLSTTLTTLTDDILRTSSRLAYEVEILRAEALSLTDSLLSQGKLHESIARFVPSGIDKAAAPSDVQALPSRHIQEDIPSKVPLAQPQIQFQSLPEPLDEPSSLSRLRTLLHVRSQLQTVIQHFNLALSFSFPPSLLSTTASSLISVNPPNQHPDLESKGHAALSRIKQEILDLLAFGDGLGKEKARGRVQELREICEIWKGTGEEKARSKWVEGLDGFIEDEIRKREDLSTSTRRDRPEVKRENSVVRTTGEGNNAGFLRRLREEIYMD